MKYRKLHEYKYLLEDVELVEINTQVEVIGQLYFTIGFNYMVIHKGYAWDGPSGPTIDTDNFMLGSLVHDVFYQAIREGMLPRSFRKTADQEFRRICIEQGMSKFRAWYVYNAVRLFSGGSAKPEKNPRGEIVELKVVTDAC